MPAVAVDHKQTGVLGLWHLGCVAAACLADAGHEIIGIDPDEALVTDLLEGRPPVSEPGLAELLAACSARMRFSTDPRLLTNAGRAWVTFDTPVDEDDNADVELVLEHSARMLLELPTGALVIVSSQLPVGSVAALRRRCADDGRDDLRFACVPENLRLGQALDAFRTPDRIVAGVRDDADRRELAELLAPFQCEVQWMRVESAEMTKHALNGFLATSVAFINEVAAICESVGADAAEVSRGLKSERRIGPRAYLAPGEAFAGGTLARDIGFLRGLAEVHRLPASVVGGVADGNAAHKLWADRRLVALLGADTGSGERKLAGRVVSIWGLTYKPGTDTLRRSSALELCRRLVDAGARVRAHDPTVRVLPSEAGEGVELFDDPLEAASGADALVVCTAWPVYRDINAEDVIASLGNAIVLDPAGFLADVLSTDAGISYIRVGTPVDDLGARAAITRSREEGR